MRSGASEEVGLSMADSRRSGPSGKSILRRYLYEISNYAQLSHEEERQLAQRIQQGDEDALRQLVESNLRFVVAYAKRYRNRNVSLLDLIHEGNLGLIQAAKKYDPFENGQDVKFITYAVWWIRQAILHALAEHGGTFRLPQKQANTLYKLERARRELHEELGRPPSEEELSDAADISLDDVRHLTNIGQGLLSLNEPIDEEGESELGDLVEQTQLPSTDAAMVLDSFQEALRDAMGELSEREQEVLRLRFGLDDDQPRTLREIGRIMGLSRERVRQIESRALARLRRSRRAGCLASYLN